MRSVDLPVGRLVGWSVGQSVGRLVGWSVGRLVGWLVGVCLVWSLAGFGWRIDWFAGEVRHRDLKAGLLCSVAWYVVWYGVACGMVWCGVAWCGVV